ncbi:MAG: hypothetical protein OSA24_01180 [Longimicrobiales bacterium]|nr:hypothetical protein [Longimicrobiales bacterium]
MTKTSTAALLGSLLLFSGCLSANFTPTSGSLYEPRPSDCDIEVFSSGPPDRAFEEIGVLEGQGKAWKAELRDVLPVMMEEGCQAGGDAIVMTSSNTFAEGEAGIANQRITATLIRWKNE